MICEGAVSALGNPLILKKVFEFSTPVDLRSIRLVCREWENLSHEEWAERSTVNLDSQNLSAFTKFLEDNGNPNLYSNIHLSGLRNLKEPVWEPIRKLFCGTNIKILEISKCISWDDGRFREFIYGRTPNLKKLVLQNVNILGVERNFSEDTNQIAIPEWKAPEFGENWNLKYLTIENYELQEIHPTISWMDVLSHFPGLQYISLKGSNQNNGLGRIFKTINKIRQHHANKLCLDRITILVTSYDFTRNVADPSGLVSFMSDPVIHLGSISVGVYSQNRGNKLCAIFSKHGTTVQNGPIKNYDPVIFDQIEELYQESFLDPLQIFNQLNTNVYHVTELVMNSRVFTTLEVLKFTPQLKKLKMDIQDKYPSIVAQTKKVNMECVRLKHCSDFEFNKLLAGEELQALMDWMPNVEILKMPLDNNTFHLVCKTWTDLVSLEIFDSLVDERGLTGMNNRCIEMINKREEQLLPPMNPLENIVGLTELRSLVLTAHKYYGPSLGYAAAKYGVGKLAKLEKLCIHGYKLDGNIWNDIRAKYQV